MFSYYNILSLADDSWLHRDYCLLLVRWYWLLNHFVVYCSRRSKNPTRQNPAAHSTRPPRSLLKNVFKQHDFSELFKVYINNRSSAYTIVYSSYIQYSMILYTIYQILVLVYIVQLAASSSIQYILVQYTAYSNSNSNINSIIVHDLAININSIC